MLVTEAVTVWLVVTVFFVGQSPHEERVPRHSMIACQHSLNAGISYFLETGGRLVDRRPYTGVVDFPSGNRITYECLEKRAI